MQEPACRSDWFCCVQAGYAKDLALVGRDLNSVLIVENTPDCVRGHEENGILVSDYEVCCVPLVSVVVSGRILAPYNLFPSGR